MSKIDGWTLLTKDRGMERATSWVRWILAGRPRVLPVVTRRGSIDVCRHGHVWFRDWSLDFQRSSLHPTRDLQALVRGLEKIYGHTMVDSVPGCVDCQWIKAQA